MGRVLALHPKGSKMHWTRSRLSVAQGLTLLRIWPFLKGLLFVGVALWTRDDLFPTSLDWIHRVAFLFGAAVCFASAAKPQRWRNESLIITTFLMLGRGISLVVAGNVGGSSEWVGFFIWMTLVYANFTIFILGVPHHLAGKRGQL